MLFRDRTDAGRQLGQRLLGFKPQGAIVLALPRGGVPVGFAIAEALDAPLDVIIARKLGAPGLAELAIGAIAEGTPAETVIDQTIVAELGVSQAYLDAVIERETREIARRQAAYRRGRAPMAVKDRVAIVVDDGIATGATMRAALRVIRRGGPARTVMAVPVAPPDSIAALGSECDQTVCLATPEMFQAISQFYAEFHQLEDAEVTELLDRAAKHP